MNLNLTVNAAAAAALFGEVAARLGTLTGLHAAMGEAVTDATRHHIATTKQSPNTGWWGRAARSVKTSSVSGTLALVEVSQRGAALRYHGGTVSQKPGGPLLTIPTEHVPVRDGTRLAARDIDDLAYIPRRSADGKRKGFLVQGEKYTVSRGKNKGKTRTRPVFGPWQVFYILRTETTHKPDPTVLPTDAVLGEAAREAAADYVFGLGGQD